jgi:hypothetical protein
LAAKAQFVEAARPPHLAAPGAGSIEVVERTDAGDINWSLHLWQISGRSLPVSPALSVGGPIRQAGGAMALAHTDAMHRVTALLTRMVRHAQGTGRAPLALPAALHDRALRALGEGRAVATEFFADGHVVWTRDFPWDGALAEVLTTARAQAQATAPRVVVGGRADFGTSDTFAHTAPTGLNINARGLQVRPCLLPELHDGNGRVLYDILSVTPEALAAGGLARYMRSLDAAARDVELGPHPALLRARALGPGCALVLEDREATVVAAAFAAVQAAKVIIVVD